MPEERNVIELRILDNDFSVKAGESEEYIRRIADFVNKELGKVKERNPFTNHIRIAILGCMNITEMLMDAQKDVDAAKQKQAEAVQDAGRIQERLDASNKDIEVLKEEKLALIEDKDQLQKEIAEKDELLNQYREHLKQAKAESEENRKVILDLQNQLFEKEIELAKAKTIDSSVAAQAPEVAPAPEQPAEASTAIEEGEQTDLLKELKMAEPKEQ